MAITEQTLKRQDISGALPLLFHFKTNNLQNLYNAVTMCETKYDVFLKMNALFQYIHSFINKYNFNLYVTSIQPHFLLCNHKKECSVTRQIPEVDTCQIPALPLRKPNPTTLELHGLITTLEFAQKETNSL